MRFRLSPGSGSSLQRSLASLRSRYPPTASGCDAVWTSGELVVSGVAEHHRVSDLNDRPPDRRRDSQQLVRQWALLRLLSDATQPYGVKQLAEQLGVSKATIERDLATLERDFAVVEESAGTQKKAYRIDQKIRALETLTFGTSELLAIYAAQSMLVSLSGTPLHDDLRAVMLKIPGFLSPRHNGGLDALSRVFVPHARGYVDYGPQHDQIDQITDAIARRRVCDLTYHAAWKGTTRRHHARPLRLVWHRAALYLLACLGDHQRITTLAVHRIRREHRAAGVLARGPRSAEHYRASGFHTRPCCSATTCPMPGNGKCTANTRA
jgi:predicted DNA-binding transcriptional regulator YafY